MPSYRTLTVASLLEQRPGIQRVMLDDGSRAYALTTMVGEVEVGDEVVVNTTAVELGLGTGGWHVVHWNLSRREHRLPGPGHIMKLRYTSSQADTGSAEEARGGAPADGGSLPSLGGTPVLAGTVHSQLGVVAAVIKASRPSTRISYVMTDGGALPIVISDLVARLRDRGLIDATITCGHAFGGDLEAVGVPSALDLAVDAQHAEVVVCVMGPGVVGTGSVLGTTALDAAAVLATAARLGGRPVIVARASGADPRERHRGLSHHTLTTLALTADPVDVPLPAAAAESLVVPPPHVRHPVGVPDVGEVLRAAGLVVTTMGRGVDDDRLFFEVAAAAGTHAVNLIGGGDTVARP